MRYKVHVNESDGLRQPPVAEAGTYEEADRIAQEHAWDGEGGTSVLDSETGLVHLGEPDRWMSMDEAFPDPCQ